MIRDITIGQYYDTDSVLHRLDPRVKLAFTFIYIISLFVGHGPICYAYAAAFLVLVIVLSRVPVKFMVKGLRSILVILVISSLFNIFLVQGEIIFSWWIIRISKEGLKTAAMMVVRIVFLVIGSSIMTLTTTPNDLTDGLEKALRFLKVIRVPVHEIAMMMSIALRFIPILIEEVNKIMKAQIARGADFESGGLIKKAKAMIPLLIPLFVSAFRRASDLALAMEARCYHGGEGRTKLHPLKYKREDFIAYAVLLVYMGGMITMAVLLP
ncbi:MAG: energy-coupling factor transporter transmembrane protein EcfT [Lachnospiraceae bacterium]|nr:energy-coupling factor transporter transmembrane protein EcfT [Lachnospiraceae bacterium]